jgi:hypothetical protein
MEETLVRDFPVAIELSAREELALSRPEHAVMDIGDAERRNGLDELEWFVRNSAAGAEPEPGLPS